MLDSLGKPVLADHLDVSEDPLVRGAMGSSAFDSEGVRTKARDVVVAGILQGYFLSTYTARKLNMQTTGNAGGSHNRSEEHTSELQSLMRTSYAAFCLKKKNTTHEYYEYTHR